MPNEPLEVVGVGPGNACPVCCLPSHLVSDEQIDLQKQIAAWLNEKWASPSKNCPVCTANNWILGEELVEVRPFQGGGLVVGGPVFPKFMIICSNCGHTLLFNAALAGIEMRSRSSSGEDEERPA